MPRPLPVINGKKLVRFFQAMGFVKSRTKGSHCILRKRGIIRPIVVPLYDEIPKKIILNNLKTSGLTQQNLLDWLKK
ncbi:MAG: type II toxin-antitoxin system HicA family toxin [Gammaproteobacteria bacterium]